MKGDFFEKMRRWIVVVGFVFAASGFWGFVAAAVVRYSFDVVSDEALLFIGLAVAILMSIYLAPKMWRSFGAEHQK